MLLLSSLRAADATVVRPGDLGVGNHYIAVLLQHEADAREAQAALSALPYAPIELPLPSAARAHIRTAWTMRPPSAHSADVHAVTASRA